jgi:DNA-binding SARP family transcriptional activator
MGTTEQLHIYLFGSFRLVRDGVEISSKDWHTRQARQLFKLLLQEHGRLVPARKLIDLLWSENVESADKALRSAVSALRDVLEPAREPWLSSRFVPRGQNGYALIFPPACSTFVDTYEFDLLLGVGLQGTNTPEARALLERALLLYTGDYLAEDGEAAWALGERARLRERYCAGVLRLMQWYGELADYHVAIELGRQSLDRNACCEPLYRLIMQYQALTGDNAAALLTFQQCRQRLAAQLGADPSPQTLVLHMAILNGALPEQARTDTIDKNWSVLQGARGELERRLAEAQERALRYTIQAADYARRASNYQQALADYDAASRFSEQDQ